MDRQLFWVSLLIAATLGTWLWSRVTGAVSGPLMPLLNFAAGFAVAGAAVLVARHVAGVGGDDKRMVGNERLGEVEPPDQLQDVGLVFA